MRIYIAYKLRGRNLHELRPKLEEITSLIENLGHKTFLFVRDVQNWRVGEMTSKKIMETAMAEMKKCDLIISIIESNEKSEGLLLESGYMKGLGKKLIVASKKECSSTFLKTIADNFIEFKDIEEFERKIKKII